MWNPSHIHKVVEVRGNSQGDLGGFARIRYVIVLYTRTAVSLTFDLKLETMPYCRTVLRFVMNAATRYHE